MSIRLKLTIMFFTIALIPLLFVGALTYNNYKNSLETTQLSQLQNIAAFKAEQIETYFAALKADIEVAQGLYSIKKNLPVLTRFANEPNNPEFIAAQKMLDGQLPQMQTVLGLFDIMLVDPKGKVVYSSNTKHHPKEFLRLLPDPEQKAFEEGKNKVYFTNVFTSEAEGGRLEILVTASAVDFNSVSSGVIAFEVDMASIYNLIHDRTGLGNTGETLLGHKIGNHVEYLSPLRHDQQAVLSKRITLGEKTGLPIQEAVQGKKGAGISIDYRGKKVIAAWQYIPSLEWGLVAKIDAEEAFADVTNLRNLVILILVIIFILSGIMAFSIAKSISEPIQRLSKGAEIVGSGNLDYKIGTNLKDEVGQLSRSFDKMTFDLKQTLASRDELNREIIERKQAQEALQASETRYRRLFEAARDGILILDAESGRIVDVNPFIKEMLGHSHEEFLNKKIWEIGLLKNIAASKEAFLELQNKGYVRYENMPLETKDGRHIAVEFVSNVYLVDHKKVIQCNIRDITARVQAEEKLDAARITAIIDKNRLEAVLETFPAGVALTDIKGGNIKSNSMFEKIWGGPHPITRDISDYISYKAWWTDTRKLVKPEEWASSQALQKGETVLGQIMEIERFDGKHAFIMNSAAPIFDADGNMTGSVVAILDITEQKKQERELHKLNRILKALNNSSQTMLHVQDESNYLQEVCNNIDKDCDYAMVWIGYAEDDQAKTVRPVAYAGFEEGYLETLKITWADNERGLGPTGTAIRTGKVCVCRNMLTDPVFEPWRKEAIKRGYASSIALPLLANNKALGVLTVYSKEYDPFSEDEVKLLTELTNDLAYGITAIRMRAEREKAEQQLRESQEDLKRAQAVGNIGSWRLNTIKNELTWSDENHKIFGIPKGTHMTYETFLGTIHPDDRECVDQKWTAALRGEPYDVEHKIIVNGKIKWVREKANLEFDKKGILLGGFGTTQDITELKLAAEAIRKERDFTTAVLDTAGALVVVLDKEGRITRFNRACENITGYSATEVLGRIIWDFLIPKDELEDVRQTWQALRSGDFPSNHENRWVAKDGSRYLIAWANTAIVWPDGEIEYIIATGVDITARRQAEETIRKAAAQAALLSETASQLLQSNHPQQIVNSLCDRVMEYLDCHISINYLVDESNHRLHLNAFSGIPDETAEKIEWLDFGQAICGRVAQESKRIVAENIQESCDSRADLVRSFGIKAYACHPIIAQGLVIGTLSFGTRSRTTFSEEDLFLMKTVTDQVATAMERIRAQEELQKINEQLELRVKERTSKLTEMVESLKKAENIIKTERKRFEDVLEMMPSYAILLTPDYHVAYANHTFREWFGDNNGQKCYEFLFNRTEPCETCETYKVLKTNKPHYWEWTGPNGRNYDIFDYPFTDVDGSPLIMEVGVDVTAHKQTQKALHSASRYSRGLLEASIDPLVTISPEGKITDVNNATELATGLSRQQLIGSSFSNYFTEPQKATESYHKVLSEGFVRDYPLTIRHVSGRTIDVLYNATVYKNEAGQIEGVFAAARDITEKKAAEEKLNNYRLHLEDLVKQRTEELQKINAELEKRVKSRTLQLQTLAAELSIAEQRERKRLAQMLHDDLQQLLAAAKFSLGALKSRVQDNELLKILSEAGNLLAESIKTSRALTSELSPPVLHEKGLTEALRWLGNWMQDKHGLTVEVEIDSQAQLPEEEISGLLFQAVRELLFNVIKHAKVKKAQVQLNSFENEHVQITVSDNGNGFDIKKVNERRLLDGGFGLFSIRERLGVLGGRFEMKSTPGKGTRITLIAPVCLTKKESTKKSSA